MRKLTCVECGAEYKGHAEYCNLCGGTQFASDEPARTGPAFRGDGTILVAHGTLWLVSVLFFVGARHERDPLDLAQWWLATAALATVAMVVTRHVRAALVFAALGALMFGAAAVVGAA